MRVIDDISRHPVGVDSTALTIGAYDGVHLGHRAVIGEVRRERPSTGHRQRGRDLRPAPRRGRPARLRAAAAHRPRPEARAARVDRASTYARRHPLRRGRGRRSRPRTSSRRCSSTASARGSWWWGRTSTSATSRQGNVALLERDGRRARLRGDRATTWSAPTARPAPDEASVSSTAIRRALVERRPRPTPTRMLGRPHEMRGPVVARRPPGRELGFPTANVAISPRHAAARPTASTPAGSVRADGDVRSVGDLRSAAGRRSTRRGRGRCSRSTARLRRRPVRRARAGSRSATGSGATSSSTRSRRCRRSSRRDCADRAPRCSPGPRVRDERPTRRIGTLTRSGR